jgi:hypothetical protein
LHARAASESLRRRNRGLRLQEYTDQARAVLLGQFAGELQDASRLGMPIDEDDDFSERSLALVWAQGCSLRRRRRH